MTEQVAAPPAAFLLPADLRGPAFPTKDGGITDNWSMTQLVKALDDPRSASQWLVYVAPGSLRPVLPLALSRLALEDPEAAMALSRKIPEEYLAGVAFTAIAHTHNIAASQGFPKASELCGDAARHILSNTWLHHDKDAAEAWREAQWIFD